MRAAAILGPGNVARSVAAFQRLSGAEWTSLIEQADVAVIFGGDGTVHRHLSTLLQVDVPLLIVPCGSGNDFAHALGLRSVLDAVRAWCSFNAVGDNMRHIDLGVIRELPRGPLPVAYSRPKADEAAAAPDKNYFCCVAGVGIDSEIAKRANALPRWMRAHGGYALSASRELLRFTPLPVRVSPDGTQAAFQPTILVAVANAPIYGGGMRIAPRAKLDDGQLDVCIVRAMGMLKLFSLFPTVYFGRHLGIKEVEYEQTPTVKIETEYPLDVYADGEYVCQTPVEFSLAPQVLRVLVPG